MKVYRKRLAIPVIADADGNVADAVETFYDPHVRTWTALVVDKNGDQIGHAEYDVHREDATRYAFRQAHKWVSR